MTSKFEYDTNRNMGIFMPYAAERIEKIKSKKKKFVHYTSAENAINIIDSGEIWMRNTMTMADYTEVEHGHDYLLDYFSNKNNKEQFLNAFSQCHDGVAEEAFKLFDSYWNSISLNTFITCISEHDPDSENDHGRLSMWRAFDKGTVGVALVLNSEVFFSESDVLNAFTSPVSYLTARQFGEVVQTIIMNVKQEEDYLSTLPREHILGQVFNILLFATTCSKHPVFLEEHEWRIIHLPDLFPSKIIKSSIEVISGVPQNVHKIPLEDFPDQGFVGASIPKLIDKIIIGPSDFAVVVASALKKALNNKRVENPDSKIVYSNIPLRD